MSDTFTKESLDKLKAYLEQPAPRYTMPTPEDQDKAWKKYCRDSQIAQDVESRLNGYARMESK